jgi:hypothetical protein
MAENSKNSKPNFKMPGLDMNKLNVGAGGMNGFQMTTREEQEQYKIHGVQDGKVEELVNYEKRKDNEKKKTLKINADASLKKEEEDAIQ